MKVLYAIRDILSTLGHVTLDLKNHQHLYLHIVLSSNLIMMQHLLFFEKEFYF